MIEQLKSKIEELELKKQELNPKLEEIEKQRAEEIAEIDKRYDHLIADAKIEVTGYEQKIMNDMIDIFSKVIMDEFDLKRSTSEYRLSDNFKEFREDISKIKFFPKELVEKLDKVIDGDLIENVAYDLEKIENQFKSL